MSRVILSIIKNEFSIPMIIKAVALLAWVTQGARAQNSSDFWLVVSQGEFRGLSKEKTLYTSYVSPNRAELYRFRGTKLISTYSSYNFEAEIDFSNSKVAETFNDLLITLDSRIESRFPISHPQKRIRLIFEAGSSRLKVFEKTEGVLGAINDYLDRVFNPRMGMLDPVYQFRARYPNGWLAYDKNYFRLGELFDSIQKHGLEKAVDKILTAPEAHGECEDGLGI